MIGRSVIFLAFWLATIFSTSKGWAMASKHLHYVDKNAPDKVYQEDPSGEWTRKVIRGDFYEVVVNFPQDHRMKSFPGKQWSFLSAKGTLENPIQYRILKYEILNDDANQIKKVRYDFEFRERGYQDVEAVLGRTFDNNGSHARFTAYTSIPPDAKEIQINIEIEITSSKGEKAVVKEAIPLKRSYYKTSFWEGLRP